MLSWRFLSLKKHGARRCSIENKCRRESREQWVLLAIVHGLLLDIKIRSRHKSIEEQREQRAVVLNIMGDAISSLLFQPPPPTRLKESKVIWLTNSFGKRIPSFFIECAKDERGEGMRAPLPGEQQHHNRHSHSTDYDDHAGGVDDAGGYYNNNNYGAQHLTAAPSTPQIRTPKELEMSVAMIGRGGAGGTSSSGLHGAPTILYSHANAEDLGNIYPWCKFLSKMLGVNIFAYDYTGYGLATDQGESLLLFGQPAALANSFHFHVHSNASILPLLSLLPPHQ